MLVFLSWSGPRSKAAAHILQDWLPRVVQAVEPWMSDTDIEARHRPMNQIGDRLERSQFGIICLTHDNQSSPWMLFEAGAISKSSDSHVCTLLVDLDISEIHGPLAQFQHTTVEKASFHRLLRTINNTLAREAGRSLSEPILEELFEASWPTVEAKLLALSDDDISRGWVPRLIHHVSLSVHDVDRSIRFYRNVVGLREAKRPKHFDFRGAWFRLPSGQQLHLLENAHATFRKAEAGIDYRDCHFALRVRSIAAAKAHFEKHGVEMVGNWDLASSRYMGGYILDPDGHVIEINTPHPGEVDPEYLDIPDSNAA